LTSLVEAWVFEVLESVTLSTFLAEDDLPATALVLPLADPLTVFCRPIFMVDSSLFIIKIYYCSSDNTPSGIRFACPTIAVDD